MHQQPRIEKFNFFSLRDFRYEPEKKPAALETLQKEALAMELELPPPPPNYSEKDLEAAKAKAHKEGYEKGFAEGEQQARSENESRENALLSSIKNLVNNIMQMNNEHQKSLRHMEQETARLSYEIARIVAGDALKSSPEVPILKMVEECLPLLVQEPKINVALNPAVITIMRDKLEHIARKESYEGTLQIIPDQNLAEYDCDISWKSGRASASADEVWANISHRLLGTQQQPLPKPIAAIQNESIAKPIASSDDANNT